MNTRECAHDMIATILLLSLCDGLVGTASSNLMRLAFQVRNDKQCTENCVELCVFCSAFV